MNPVSAPDVTSLLVAWREGKQGALAQLMPVVYGELRRIADNYLRRERADHTLQPTALIHEAYLKMARSGTPDWKDRAHFFGIASRLMRQILVDWARKHYAGKRGGETPRTELDGALLVSYERRTDLIALDDALEALARFDEGGCRAVEMKYFGGLSSDEMAEALGVSASTVRRQLRVAEAWLRRELTERAGI